MKKKSVWGERGMCPIIRMFRIFGGKITTRLFSGRTRIPLNILPE